MYHRTIKTHASYKSARRQSKEPSSAQPSTLVRPQEPSAFDRQAAALVKRFGRYGESDSFDDFRYIGLPATNGDEASSEKATQHPERLFVDLDSRDHQIFGF